MAGDEQVEAIRRGATTWNDWRASRPDVTPDLSGANLNGANLDGADLSRANLHEVALDSARLHDANLSCADLRQASLVRTAARDADFTGADLRGADVRQSSWRGADVSGADARGASFQFSVLASTNLRETNLTGADVTHADLSGANLTGVDLSGARVHHARLVGATLSTGTLDGANGAATAIRSPGDPEPFERTPLGVSTTEPKPGHLSSMFACQRPGCHQAAGWVAVIAKGVPHPDDALLHRDLLETPGTAGQILAGGFLGVDTSSSLDPDTFERVAAGLREGDVLTLWEASEDYAPFYCTCCHAVFCAEDSNLREVWDPDWGMTPDYWTGTCPNGHPIFIDH